MVQPMTNSEKTLVLRLNHVLLRLREWEKEWDPKDRGPTTARWWRVFQKFLIDERKRLEKELDAIQYIDVL